MSTNDQIKTVSWEEIERRWDEQRGTLSWKVRNIFWTVYRFLEGIPSNIRDFWQRGRRGYAYTDVWSLCSYLADWLPAALRQLKEKHVGVPNECIEAVGGDIKNPGEVLEKADELWIARLEQMAQGFEAFSKEDACGLQDEEQVKKIRKLQDTGIRLFAEHFMNLWD